MTRIPAQNLQHLKLLLHVCSYTNPVWRSINTCFRSFLFLPVLISDSNSINYFNILIISDYLVPLKMWYQLFLAQQTMNLSDFTKKQNMSSKLMNFQSVFLHQPIRYFLSLWYQLKYQIIGIGPSLKYWNLSRDTQPQQRPHGVLPSVPCCASCPRRRERVQSWAYWWSVDVWVPFQSRGVKSFYYKRSLKTLHLTYLGMLHTLYYMKEKNCKLLLLWHIMLE